MKITSRLIQIYFLALRPKDMREITDKLPTLELHMTDEHLKVGRWQQFSWMGRHGLCVMRDVGVTSGLDCFLLAEDGMPGIQDIAEIMVFPFADGLPEPPARGGQIWCGSLEELRAGDFAEALGFITFVRLNRALLETHELWKAGRNLPVPSLAELLRGTATTIQEATADECWKEEMQRDLRLMLAAGCGDSEIVILGSARNRATLDKLLYLLTKLGADSIGAALYGDENAASIPAEPAVAETVTELLVPMELYKDALAEAEAKPPAGGPSPELRTRLRRCLSGDVGGQLWLKRGVNSLADLGHAVGATVGDGWQDLTVLGNVDVLVQPTRKMEIDELLWMLAKVDAQAAACSTFPRKVAFSPTFEPWGKEAAREDDRVPARYRREKPALPDHDRPRQMQPAEPAFEATPEDIKIVRAFVEELRRLHWREDMRVVERVAERSVAVRKNETLPADSRLMADRCLKRMSQAVQDLRALEENIITWASMPERQQAVEAGRNQAASLRLHLVEAGMLFDRAVAHHMRGALPLLLQPAFQARGPEHFCSEVMLSAGMAAFPRSVVGRMIQVLQQESTLVLPQGEDLGYRDMMQQLRAVAAPILYASHDEDFEISPMLGIIRIPRWVLWYPTASSMLVHEVGHALCKLASFSHAARQMARSFTEPSMQHVAENLALNPWIQETAKGGKPGAWTRELEEISADVTWRILCYSQDQTGQFVSDYLNYIDGRSARMPDHMRRTFLHRLLASVVANRQIASGWASAGASLRAPSATAALDELVRITGRFLAHLRAWHQAHAPSAVKASRYLMDEVADFCARLETLTGQRSPESDEELRRLCGAGQFTAWMWLAPGLQNKSSLGDMPWWRNAHMIWRSVLVAATQIQPRDEEQLRRIAGGLAQGLILNETTRFPERLPALVEDACRILRTRAAAQPWAACDIPVNTRFALSMFLQSNLPHY